MAEQPRRSASATVPVTAATRSKHRDKLNEEIDSHTVKRTSAEWIELLNKAGVPCGPINSVAQAFQLAESLGLMPGVARSESGYRQYDDNTVHTLRFIRRARDLESSGLPRPDVLAQLEQEFPLTIRQLDDLPIATAGGCHGGGV